MTPSYHTRFKEAFPASFFCCGADTCPKGCSKFSEQAVLTFIEEVTNEAYEYGQKSVFVPETEAWMERGRAAERAALRQLVERMKDSFEVTLLSPGASHREVRDAAIGEAFDAVLAHLRTGEETWVSEKIATPEGEYKITEKGGSSFSGPLRERVVLDEWASAGREKAEEIGGKIHKILNKTLDRTLTRAEYRSIVRLIGAAFKIGLSAPEKETPPQPQDGIREGCRIEGCVSAGESHGIHAVSIPGHSPREEGGELRGKEYEKVEITEHYAGGKLIKTEFNGIEIPAPTEEKPNQ